MRARGMAIREIARICGKSRTSVRCAVDPVYYAKQIALNYEAKQLERDRLAERAGPSERAKRTKQAKVSLDRIAARSYFEKPEPVRNVITLPRISLPELPSEMDAKPQIRFAPIPRVTVTPGVERWRDAHRKMIRSGKIASPDLMGEMR